jgi:signal transduction histidine kinase/CheY-like chemotaxis protein
MGAALRAGGSGAWVYDPEVGTLELSPGLPEVLGVSGFDGTYAGFIELVHPADRSEVERRVQQALGTPGDFTIEYRLGPEGAPTRWFEGRGRTVARNDGQPLLMGFVQDVTERYLASDTLAGVARSLVLEGKDSVGQLVRHVARVVDANTAFVATLLPPEATRLRTDAVVTEGALVEPFSYDVEGSPCQEVLSGGVRVLEHTVRAQFTTAAWLEQLGARSYAGCPVLDEQGKVIGVLVALWRTTPAAPSVIHAALQIFASRAGAELARLRVSAERARAEELLERHNAALGEVSRSDVWQRHDRDAAFRMLTEVGARTLRIQRVGIWLFDAEQSQIELRDLFTQETESHSSGAVLRRSDNPAYFDSLVEGRVVAADDAHADPRTSAFADGYLSPLGITSMLDSTVRVGGRTIGVLCCEHVGPRRSWSPEEIAFAGSLSEFVGLAVELDERRELESQLFQAQKMDSIGRLAGGLAHDFNNLLTAIVGSAELARLDAESAGQDTGYLEEILDASHRAATLTSQLLAFARKQVIESKLLSINEVIERAQSVLRRLLDANIELEVSLDPTAWTVRADPSRLEQVLVNLVVNARDAMEQGGRVRVQTHNRDVGAGYGGRQAQIPPGPYVVLTVSDTGSGISPEALPRIFEPFFTTKARERGTGLGLATCHGIVNQVGGHIVARSTPGEGSTFEVLLPRVDARATPADADRPHAATRGGHETLLLIEDDPRVRKMTLRALTSFGYRVIAASDAEEAMSAASAEPGEIHLIVTDVVIPGSDGRHVAESLGAARPGVRVLYVSGYADDTVLRHGLLEPGVDFLPKPFTPTALARTVREILDRPGESGPRQKAPRPNGGA